MVCVSQRKLFFSCGVLRGCAGVEGAFALGGVPSCPREEKRLPRPLPARGARLQTEAEPGYFPPQTLRVSGGRSNHLGLFRWKNLPGISRPSARTNVRPRKQRKSGHTLVGKRAAFYTLLSCHPPAFLLSTSRSSTLPSAWAVKPRGAPGGALHGGGRLHGVRVCQRSTMRSSTLPCSKYQENHPVP